AGDVDGDPHTQWWGGGVPAAGVGERFCGGDRPGRALSVAGEGRAHVEAAGRGGAGGPLLGPLAVGGGTQGAAQARGGTLLGGGGPAGAGDRIAGGCRCAVGVDGGATGVEDRLGGGGGFASLAGPLGAVLSPRLGARRHGVGRCVLCREVGRVGGCRVVHDDLHGAGQQIGEALRHGQGGGRSVQSVAPLLTVREHGRGVVVGALVSCCPDAGEGGQQVLAQHLFAQFGD